MLRGGLRQYVLARDGYQCQHPQHQNTEANYGLTIHHITPASWWRYWYKGTPDIEHNLITLCPYCHQGYMASTQDICNLVIHQDQAWEFYNHPTLEPAESIMEYLRKKRRKCTEKRKVWWNDRWDKIFQDLTEVNSESHWLRTSQTTQQGQTSFTALVR